MTGRVTPRQTKTPTLTKRKKANRTIAGALEHGDKATAQLTVKLTDASGNTSSEKLTVRLKG